MMPVWCLPNPTGLLANGSQIYTNDAKVRVFFIRRVSYDDGLTPLWSTPIAPEKFYFSLAELLKDHPRFEDTNILDYDKQLSLYHEAAGTTMV